MALRQGGRHRESVPYFARVAAVLPSVWQAHANYSTALHDAAQESRLQLGKPGPAVRSSDERVRMVHESLRELDAAERCAATTQERALVVIQRAQRLQNWGLPLDALVEFRRASALDTSSRDLALYLEQAVSLLSAR